MTNESLPNGEPVDVEAIKQENASLRKKLERARFEADMYRETAYKWYNERNPYVPPTEEELHDMVHGPRGQSPLEVLEEFEKKYLRDQE